MLRNFENLLSQSLALAVALTHCAGANHCNPEFNVATPTSDSSGPFGVDLTTLNEIFLPNLQLAETALSLADLALECYISGLKFEFITSTDLTPSITFKTFADEIDYLNAATL